MQRGPILRPWLEGSRTYRPGLRARSPAGRLASNESPEPPSWLAREGLTAADLDLHRYPDPGAGELREAIAAKHGVDPHHVVVGNGSDELIMLIIQAYAAFTGSIVVATPGYSLYALCATRLGSQHHQVPLVGWKHDLAGMARVECDIAFVCNPHNPSGTVVEAADLGAFIESSAARLIVIDEAYIDFSTEPRLNTAAAAVADPRVVVLRTFSKAHALAGLRVGYLLAHQNIARTLDGLRLPFSVNSLAQALSLRSLHHPDETARAVEAIVATRRRVEEILSACGFDYVPSQGNFVLVLSEQSDRVVEHLASHGIAVRPGRDVGVENAVRLTIPSTTGLPALERAVRDFTGTMLTS